MIVLTSHKHRLCYFAIPKCGSSKMRSLEEFEWDQECGIVDGYTKFTICRVDVVDRFVSAYLEDLRIFEESGRILLAPDTWVTTGGEHFLGIGDERERLIMYLRLITRHNDSQTRYMGGYEMDRVFRLMHLQDDFDLVDGLELATHVNAKTQAAKDRVHALINESLRGDILQRYADDVRWIEKQK